MRFISALMACFVVVLSVAACGSRVSATGRAVEQVPDFHGAPAGTVAAPEWGPVAVEAVPVADPAPSGEPGAGATPPKSRGCDWKSHLDRATAGRSARWIVRDTGAWGRAEVPGERIWIAPRTPCDKVYSVAVHEWTHHMQGVVYGDWGVVLRELAPYGGPEVVADCGAVLLGATWIKYGCTHQLSRHAAALILDGQRP